MLGKLELRRHRKVNLPAVATGYDRRPRSMEYPHWLIIAGAILLMLASSDSHCVHDALKRAPSDMTNDQEPIQPEVDLTPAEVYERAAKEKRRARWAGRERELEEPANDRPSIFGEELNDRAYLRGYEKADRRPSTRDSGGPGSCRSSSRHSKSERWIVRRR